MNLIAICCISMLLVISLPIIFCKQKDTVNVVMADQKSPKFKKPKKKSPQKEKQSQKDEKPLIRSQRKQRRDFQHQTAERKNQRFNTAFLSIERPVFKNARTESTLKGGAKDTEPQTSNVTSPMNHVPVKKRISMEPMTAKERSKQNTMRNDRTEEFYEDQQEDETLNGVKSIE